MTITSNVAEAEQAHQSSTSISFGSAIPRMAAAQVASSYTASSSSSSSCSSCSSGLRVQEYMDRSRKAGKFLQRALHSLECQGACSRECMNSFQMAQHAQRCASPSCRLPGCSTAKKLLSHYKNCEKKAMAMCLICSIAQAGEGLASADTSRDFEEEPSYEEQDSEDQAYFFFEEGVQCNRVPFQALRSPAQRRHSIAVASPMTRNASGVGLGVEELGEQQYQSGRPRLYSDQHSTDEEDPIDANDQPRKVRSKSWTVTSTDNS